MKRQPNEATNPPNTADNLVLFLLHIETQTGDRNNEIAKDKAPNQPVQENQIIIITI